MKRLVRRVGNLWYVKLWNYQWWPWSSVKYPPEKEIDWREYASWIESLLKLSLAPEFFGKILVCLRFHTTTYRSTYWHHNIWTTVWRHESFRFEMWLVKNFPEPQIFTSSTLFVRDFSRFPIIIPTWHYWKSQIDTEIWKCVDIKQSFGAWHYSSVRIALIFCACARWARCTSIWHYTPQHGSPTTNKRVWDPHQGGFWGRNFPTREFEGMDSLMMAARLLRVGTSGSEKNKKYMLLNFIANLQ